MPPAGPVVGSTLTKSPRVITVVDCPLFSTLPWYYVVFDEVLTHMYSRLLMKCGGARAEADMRVSSLRSSRIAG